MLIIYSKDKIIDLVKGNLFIRLYPFLSLPLSLSLSLSAPLSLSLSLFNGNHRQSLKGEWIPLTFATMRQHFSFCNLKTANESVCFFLVWFDKSWFLTEKLLHFWLHNNEQVARDSGNNFAWFISRNANINYQIWLDLTRFDIKNNHIYFLIVKHF